MKYSYVRFPDDTEITYGDIDSNNNVVVHVETPVDGGFNSLICILPSYQILECTGYSEEQAAELMRFLHNNAHLIIEFAMAGGFENAAAI